MRPIGKVKLVQIQPDGLFIDSSHTPTGYYYDPSRLVTVDQLIINPLGIEAIMPDGKQVLDIHHISHPGKEYDNDDLVSIGFTAHYAAMRTRFGPHMVDGIAGENIIIDYGDEVWSDDLGSRIGIENRETKEMAILHMQSHANPCREFSSFALGDQEAERPAAELKGALQFLGNGRRGFLLVLDPDQKEVFVRPGDAVYILDEAAR